MATSTTETTASLTKTVYGENMEKLAFELGIVTSMLPLKSGQERLGDTFKFAVTLTRENGATYNGTDGGEVTLLDPSVSTDLKAEVAAYELIMRTRIADRIMDAAIRNGPAAFGDVSRVKMEGLMQSAEFRLEHTNLYGQMGLFQTSTGASGGVITISDATFSAATIDMLEGAVLEAWDGIGDTATQHNGDLTVTAVDIANKTITVSGTSTGVVANDFLFFKGARTASGFNEAPGIMKLIGTLTGTVQGISRTTYSRWRPNTQAVSGTPTIEVMQSGVSLLAGRGARRLDTRTLVPHAAFNKFNKDLMGGRRFDGSYSRQKGVTGVETIQLVGPLGLNELIPHAMMRDGDACAFTDKNGFRAGVVDLSWYPVNPGGPASDIWIVRQDKNSRECRVHSITAPAFARPWQTVGYTGLSYT